MEKDMVQVSSLRHELDRLIERYQYEPTAIEALEAVRCWLIEECVLDEEPPPLEDMDFLCV